MAAGEQEGYVFGGSPWSDEEGSSLYSALNVPRNASKEDVRRAYRRMCVTFHPDKHNNAPDKDQARVLFEGIKDAYDVLSCPEKRFVYDILGWRGLRSEATLGLADSSCNTALEVEELRSRFERQLCQERNMVQCSPSCSARLYLDARGVFSHTANGKSRFSGLTMRKLVLNEAFKVSLSPRDTFVCQLSTESMLDGQSHGIVVGVYKHAFKSGRTLQMEMGVGSMQHVGFEFRTPLPGDCLLTTNGRLLWPTWKLSYPILLFPSFSAAIQRRIGQCTVELRLTMPEMLANEEERLKGTLSYNHSRASVELRAGGPVVLKYTHELDLGSSIVLEPHLSVSAAGVQAGYALRYTWSSNTLIGVGVRMQYPTSIGCIVKISHRDQKFVLPIEIADQVSLSTVFYAHFVPLMAVGILRYCVVKPLMYLVSREQRKDAEYQQQASVATQRNEAAMFVRLMQATYDNSLAGEQARRGLVVREAWYGALVSHRRPGTSPSEGGGGQQVVADVKVAVQCLVKDSKLILTAASKAFLPGFFDPVPSQHKSLRVRYEFHGVLHEVTVADTEALQAPKRAHLVR